MPISRPLSGIALSLFACAVAATEPIPVEEFAPMNGAYAAMDLSADGRLVVGVTLADGAPIVTVTDIGKMEATAVIRGWIDGFEVDSCGFKTSRRLLCRFAGVDHAAGVPFPVTRLVGVDVDGRNAKVLVQRGQQGGTQLQDRILHLLPDDPTHVLIELQDGDDNNIYPGVYLLDVNQGTTRRIMRPRAPILHISSSTRSGRSSPRTRRAAVACSASRTS